MSSISISKLEEVAREGSTYVVTLNFADDRGDAVVPDSATWSLQDKTGAYVNDRQDVEIAALAATKDIVLSGDDLITGTLTLSVHATYTSTAGSNLPLNGEVQFDVADLLSV